MSRNHTLFETQQATKENVSSKPTQPPSSPLTGKKRHDSSKYAPDLPDEPDGLPYSPASSPNRK